nr:MAG TPA: hypothetical protein [Caudoviricetes sp.]
MCSREVLERSRSGCRRARAGRTSAQFTRTTARSAALSPLAATEAATSTT